MASKGYLDTIVNSLDTSIRYPIQKAFYYVLDNFRLGDQARAQNAQWYKVSSTTHITANTEFTVAHGTGAAPKWLIPVLDLQAQNGQLVPLTVSKAADATYLYLKSTSTNAAFTFYVEP